MKWFKHFNMYNKNPKMTEQRKFQTDIHELLQLIIHSFYSNKDVFLRELISNASDAIDKQRHFDLQRSQVNCEYSIRLNPLMDSKQLVIEDNGIGMSMDDMIEHLSTIAKSGTKEFAQKMSDKSDMIGQFGVGFYSAFLVSDLVHVYSRKENGMLCHWYSDANDYFSTEVLEDDSETLFPHGTRICLQLKDDCLLYREETTLRQIISQYSSFILYPIQLYVEKEIETTKEEEEVEEEEFNPDKILEEELSKLDQPSTTDSDKETVLVEEEKSHTTDANTATVKETVREYQTVNGNYPIWYKKASDVSKEEYHDLYKMISKDWETPMFWRHFQTEGTYEFKGILYIPKKPPTDLLGGEGNKEKRRIKLYVKKVLVLNELDKEMLPEWMNFVVGVIDSADLPLNVSREMLQQTKVLQALKNQLKKQVMNMLNEMFVNEENSIYEEFYDIYHKNLKLGIHDGDESLMPFLHMKNSKDSEFINLNQYIESYRKDEEQKSIYYLTGSEPETSLFGKLYKEHGYTVLYFNEPIDEFVLQRTHKYKEYDLVNISKDHETPWCQETSKELIESYQSFCEWVKQRLSSDSNVDEVKVSDKLVKETDEPACIVSSKWGWTGNMERLMMSQPLNDSKHASFMKGRRIFEINMKHTLLKDIYQQYQTREEDMSSKIQLLYQCSLLSGGFPLHDTTAFVKNVIDTLHA